MTKEELEKEAVEYAEKINLQNVNISGVVRNHISQAYLAGAEPREKRIEELEEKLEQTEKDLADYQFNYPTIKELEAQIKKMKCCENCKYNSYWGNELHCNYGLKEALQKDKLVECKNMDKWEIKENE